MIQPACVEEGGEERGGGGEGRGRGEGEERRGRRGEGEERGISREHKCIGHAMHEIQPSCLNARAFISVVICFISSIVSYACLAARNWFWSWYMCAV